MFWREFHKVTPSIRFFSLYVKIVENTDRTKEFSDVYQSQNLHKIVQSIIIYV